jgi:hypothetical protein
LQRDLHGHGRAHPHLAVRETRLSLRMTN